MNRDFILYQYFTVKIIIYFTCCEASEIYVARLTFAYETYPQLMCHHHNTCNTEEHPVQEQSNAGCCALFDDAGINLLTCPGATFCVVTRTSTTRTHRQTHQSFNQIDSHMCHIYRICHKLHHVIYSCCVSGHPKCVWV